MGTVTIHRCSKCNHQSGSHGSPWADGRPPKGGGWCSMGGCSCRLSPTQVKAANDPVEVPTWTTGENPFATKAAS